MADMRKDGCDGLDAAKPQELDVTAYAPPKLDAECYLPMLEQFVASEAEKREVLALIWEIMCHFVDMGYGVDSLSLILDQAMTKPCDMGDKKLSLQYNSRTNNKDEI